MWRIMKAKLQCRSHWIRENMTVLDTWRLCKVLNIIFLVILGPTVSTNTYLPYKGSALPSLFTATPLPTLISYGQTPPPFYFHIIYLFLDPYLIMNHQNHPVDFGPSLLPPSLILGDPGADSGGEGKSKRAQNKARRKLKNGEKSPWGQCLTGPVPNGRHRSGFWLAPENLCFSGTNQKPERWRPFGTGLIRHCPQGLFSPFFAFLRALFFHSIRLSLAPTICPWVSEDVLPSVHPSYLPIFLSSLHEDASASWAKYLLSVN